MPFKQGLEMSESSVVIVRVIEQIRVVLQRCPSARLCFAHGQSQIKLRRLTFHPK